MKELNTCAWKAAWIWAVLVLAPMGLSAQCEDVLVATGLVFSQGEPAEGYGLALEVVSEHADGDLAGLTTYRLYMQTAHESDRVVAAVGDNEYPLSLMPETSFYQNPFGNNNPEGISPAWINFFPDLAFDSWVTIGLDGPSSSSAGEEGVTMLFASGWESVFGSGQGFMEDSESGSGWTVIPWTATNTLAGPDLRVLLAQLTTDGDLSGSMRVQVFPQGDNENDLRLDVWFDTDVVCGCTDPVAMNYDASANYNDGSCLYPGCIHVLACNFDPGANVDDGSCLYLNDCGECVNTCLNDLDGDGVCDDVDDCVGEFDVCGICNGPGAVFECGCSSLPLATAIATGTNWTPWACAEATAWRTPMEMASATSTTTVSDNTTPAASATDPDRSTSADAPTSRRAIAIVVETSLTCSACAEATAWRTPMATGCVTSTTIVLGSTTPAASATDPDRSTSADAPTFLRAIAIVMETSSTYSACAEETAWRTPMATACVTSTTIASGSTTRVASATDLDRSTNADVPTSPPAIAIVAETSLTCLACAGATAWRMQMATVCVTSKTIVLDSTTRVASATVPDRSTSVGAPTSPPATATAMATNLTCSESAEATAWPMRMATGVCDVDDECVGQYDACGICNGPGQVYECGCANIPAGDCDCDGNQLDVLGVCGGDCVADADGDGVCDVDDDCVGQYDACGICNGPGQVYECGCANIPAGDCDCDGNQLDVLGVCGGDCVADADGDGVCDVDDDCVGQYDACGICNGPGQVYECGCANIPAGDCDCDGNQLDVSACAGATAWRTPMETACVTSTTTVSDSTTPAASATGLERSTNADVPTSRPAIAIVMATSSTCSACAEATAWRMPDGDGICDVDDECVGQYDACGICNGLGQVYECGCANIPAGDCDCNGNQLDVLGVCGGDCVADADGDGICDVEDDCVGQYDACGICNGPGQVYECGCANIPAGDCDCDGNQADAVGECGGTCTSDVNENGLCDADEGLHLPHGHQLQLRGELRQRVVRIRHDQRLSGRHRRQRPRGRGRLAGVPPAIRRLLPIRLDRQCLQSAITRRSCQSWTASATSLGCLCIRRR